MKIAVVTTGKGVISTSTDYVYEDPAEIAVALAELKRIETVLVSMWDKTL